MSWKQLIDQHWTDFFGAMLVLLSIPCYIWVSGEFGAMIFGLAAGVIKGDRPKRKTDAGQG